MSAAAVLVLELKLDFDVFARILSGSGLWCCRIRHGELAVLNVLRLTNVYLLSERAGRSMLLGGTFLRAWCF